MLHLRQANATPTAIAPNTRGSRISMTTLYIEASHVMGKTKNLDNKILPIWSKGMKKRPITRDAKKIPRHIIKSDAHSPYIILHKIPQKTKTS